MGKVKWTLRVQPPACVYTDYSLALPTTTNISIHNTPIINYTLFVLVVSTFLRGEVGKLSSDTSRGVSSAIYLPGTGLNISRFFSFGSNKSSWVKLSFHSRCGLGFRDVLVRA